MSRHGFSNVQLDSMIARSGNDGFTRQIPDGEIARVFPYYIGPEGQIEIVSAEDRAGGGWNRCVVPAKESEAGRGQPVFDLFHPGMPVAGVAGVLMAMLWSFKITKEKGRNPRNAPVTTGTGDRHILGVVAAAGNGTEIPMINLNYHADKDQWYQLVINVADVLRKHEPVPATGARGVPLTLSVKRQKSGGRYLTYRSLRCNFAPCTKLGFTEGWVPVDVPKLPTDVTF
jgi:hypothetical protein